MEYIRLRNSELRVSRLCMGGCPMGGHGWGKVSEGDLVEAVHGALDHGVNFFDTADTYGLGKSEEILGSALKGRRQNAIIATKFGVRVENATTRYDNSPEWIDKAVCSSLQRLNTDYIDLYQIHYRDGKTPLDDVVFKLEELKEKGFIRYYGLCNIYQKDMPEIRPYIGRFVSFQDEFSLACRKHEEDLMEISETLKLTPLTWGSLGQGILTGKYDASSTFGTDDRRSRMVYANFHGDKLRKNLEIVEVLKQISSYTGRSVASIAIRFILDYIDNSVVLVGVKNLNQLLSNVESMGWELTGHQLSRLLDVSRDEVLTG